MMAPPNGHRFDDGSAARNELIAAFRNGDAGAAEAIGLSLSQAQQQHTQQQHQAGAATAAAAKAWEFDMSQWTADADFVDVVRRACDMRRVVSKPLTTTAWKVLLGMCRSKGSTEAAQREVVVFVLQQLQWSLDAVMARVEGGDLGGATDASATSAEVLNTAKFLAAQHLAVAKALPQASRSAAFDPNAGGAALMGGASGSVPPVVQCLATCSRVVTAARRSVAVSVEKDFVAAVCNRVEAALTAMVAAVSDGALLQHDMTRVLNAVARRLTAMGQQQRNDDSDRAAIAAAGFTFMVTCCRAHDGVPRPAVAQALLAWLPYMDSTFSSGSSNTSSSSSAVKSELFVAVASVARHLSATFFVEAPTTHTAALGLTDVGGAAHRWWLVATKCVLALPLVESLPLLVVGLSCPDDASVERIAALWLTMLYFAKDSPTHLDTIAAALATLASAAADAPQQMLTAAPGSAGHHTAARRTAGVAARILRLAGQFDIVRLSENTIVAASSLPVPPGAFPRLEAPWTLSATTGAEWDLDTWAVSTRWVPQPVVDRAALQVATAPVAAARILAAAASQVQSLATSVDPKALEGSLRACSASLNDGCIAALCALLAALGSVPLNVPPSVEVQLTDALRGAVEAIFNTIRPSLLAHGTTAFAEWAQRTPVNVGEGGFLSEECVAELLRYYLELQQLGGGGGASALPHSAFAPPVATTAAAYPVHLLDTTSNLQPRVPKRHRAEVEKSDDAAAGAPIELFPRTQSSDDGAAANTTTDAKKGASKVPPPHATASGSLDPTALSPEVIPPLRRALLDACTALTVATTQFNNNAVADDASRAVLRDAVRKASALLARMEAASQAINIDSD